MKQLICFDLDNTLIYSDRVHIKAFELAFRKCGLAGVQPKKIAKLLYGITAKKIIKILYPKLRTRDVDKLVMLHDRFVCNLTYKYARPIGEVRKTLQLLRKYYEIAIVSNCSHREIRALVHGAGITRKMYNTLIGKDQVYHSKPSAEMLFKAEKLLHHNAVCMVGDSILDIRAAKRAGIMVIAVLTGHNTRRELEKEGADFIVGDVNKIASILKQNL